MFILDSVFIQISNLGIGRIILFLNSSSSCVWWPLSSSFINLSIRLLIILFHNCGWFLHIISKNIHIHEYKLNQIQLNGKKQVFRRISLYSDSVTAVPRLPNHDLSKESLDSLIGFWILAEPTCHYEEGCKVNLYVFEVRLCLIDSLPSLLSSLSPSFLCTHTHTHRYRCFELWLKLSCVSEFFFLPLFDLC